MDGLRVVKEARVKTPFGSPSDKITIGEIDGCLIAFLPRHGKGHRVLPAEINVRANIYALKSLGVERLIGVGACGSLKEELAPKDLVLPDQLVDKTKGRVGTFFGDGIVAHVQFDQPFCPNVSEVIVKAADAARLGLHRGGVSVCMEGPAFSTKAESLDHRRLGYAIVGMTAVPEAKLAREAEICYASLAFVTDYDCWKEGEEAVTVEKILENLKEGSSRAQNVLRRALPLLARGAGGVSPCSCASALRYAVVTDPKHMKKQTFRKLKLLIGKYFSGNR